MTNREVLSDRVLARRLERAEGSAGARYVEARAKIAPELGALWIEVGGTYAMFDGPRSPVTQTFGLGMDGPPTAEDLDKLEAFFEERGAPVMHEVSPMADKSILEVLGGRGYRPVELTSVMFLPLGSASFPPTNPEVRVRVVGENETDQWAQTAAEGWRELTEFADQMYDLMRLTASRRDAPCFLAELDGQPIAAGVLAIHEGVALLAGASTIAEWRNRGAQLALLKARLEYAAELGCDLAMIGAEPGSGSQRNAQRQGFRIAYTRIKWGQTRHAKTD